MTAQLDPRPPRSTAPPPPDDAELSLFVEEITFSMVPEWVIDLDLPDAAFKLYALLLRYGATSGRRMPARQTLARRLRRSVDAVDRAMKALVMAGLVVVQHRRVDGAYLTNLYYVRTSRPAPTPGAPRSRTTARSCGSHPRASSPRTRACRA